MTNELIVIRNKKLAFAGDETDKLTSCLAAHGYYFDRITCVGFDSGAEISHALTDLCADFDNGVVVCPDSMRASVESYLSNVAGGRFNSDGVLETGKGHVFMIDENGGLSPEEIVSILDSGREDPVSTSYMKMVGAPPEKLDKALEETAKIPGITYRVYGSYSDVTLELMYSSSIFKSSVDLAVRTLLTYLDEYVYALEDRTLAERLFELLKIRKKTISVAESFTGGGIAKRLVEVSGISEVYHEGLNTYSNESKVARLGVTPYTLNQNGAVSPQTASEMVKGLLNTGRCNVAVATTGIAGPKSDERNSPVGLCYIAVGVDNNISVYEFHFKGDRKTVTETAINNALFLAYKNLK